MTASAVEIIVLPNELKPRASTSSGRTQRELTAQGDRLVAEKADDYTARIRNEVNQIITLVQRLESSTDNAARTVDELFTRAYHLKGIAGTFGYKLLTAIAGSLGDFLELLKSPDRLQAVAIANVAAVARAHADSMQLALRTRSHEDLGEAERQLVESLRQLAGRANPAAAR